MREIKFRAWDKINKKWIKHFNIDLLNINIFVLSNIEINQYTNVNDVNEKEIYENDIVETTWWNEQDEKYRKTGKVICKNGMCLIEFLKEDYRNYEGQSLYHAIDVIKLGNIYENKDLIGDED